jgi:defect-in-organelle-trafficking protein DotC
MQACKTSRRHARPLELQSSVSKGILFYKPFETALRASSGQTEIKKLLFLLVPLLTGCQSPVKNPELLAFTDISSSTAGEQLSVSDIRFSALRDTALSLGARAGLHYRAEQINTIVNRYQRPLDRIFPFHALVLENNVLPPVLIEGRNTLEQSTPGLLRIADRAYSIAQQAHFITTAPSWRDYLSMNFDKPELPDRTLLPRDAVESKIWDRYVQQGWFAGFEQAHTIFSENIGRLKRDTEGMIRYRVLLAQNMVSPPFVTKNEMGVTGGGNEMAVNDRILQITAMPKLQTDSAYWGTELTARKDGNR